MSYETVRRWVVKFGPAIAGNLRRLRPEPSPRWHLDEMVIRFNGKLMYLWRAVDDEGEVLEVLVQRRRDKAAARKLMRKLLKKHGFSPTQVTTDKLRSYGAAFRQLGLATSVRTGTAAPSALLRRLAAYPRQNQLAKALREIGRIKRTLATLDWLKDPDLRRRSHAGLNKGEAEHSLKRAVFFHRLGELRDRTFENQSHRASGLNLVVAAIVLWNTVYLGRAVDALRAAGEDIPADLLAHVAPLGWEHIALTGDYVWADDDVDSSVAFRPLRRIPASFQRVAA